MRAFAFAMLALSGAWSQSWAQVNQQPTIMLTIFAGVGTGHDLWTIQKQPLQVIGTSEYDTLRLSQAIGPSIILGAGATYFPSPHIGFHVELSYIGLPVDGGCTGLFFYPDFEEKNAQTCADIQARSADGGSVAMFTGVTFRASSRGSISPYARADLGIVNQSRSTIEIVGEFTTANGPGVREVISDPTPRRVSPMFGAAVGFTRPISPGYQFRWEIRDLLVPLARATGPASALAIAPIASRFYHHFSLILGLDVVLEKKRGRRY